MDVIAGFDAHDPITARSKGHVPATYLSALDPEGLRGARIGVLQTLSEQESADQDVRALFANAVNTLKTAGAELIESVDIPQLKAMQRDLWVNTFHHDIERYLGSLGKSAPFTSLEAIVASGRFDAAVANNLAEALRANVPAELGAPYSADPADAPQRQELLATVLKVMDTGQLDALIYPTWNNPPRRIGDVSSPHGNNSPFIAPHTGQPAITVPVGFTRDGLPIGLQLLGRPFCEPLLLKLAFAYEQATHHRRPPKAFPALDDEH